MSLEVESPELKGKSRLGGRDFVFCFYYTGLRIENAQSIFMCKWLIKIELLGFEELFCLTKFPQERVSHPRDVGTLAGDLQVPGEQGRYETSHPQPLSGIRQQSVKTRTGFGFVTAGVSRRI